MEWLLEKIYTFPNDGQCYRIAEILIQSSGFANSSDQRRVVVSEPVNPDGHSDTVLFIYLPGPSGQGTLLQRGSIVGVSGIKLYVAEYFASPPVTRVPEGTVYSK